MKISTPRKKTQYKRKSAETLTIALQRPAATLGTLAARGAPPDRNRGLRRATLRRRSRTKSDRKSTRAVPPALPRPRGMLGAPASARAAPKLVFARPRANRRPATPPTPERLCGPRGRAERAAPPAGRASVERPLACLKASENPVLLLEPSFSQSRNPRVCRGFRKMRETSRLDFR